MGFSVAITKLRKNSFSVVRAVFLCYKYPLTLKPNAISFIFSM